MPDPVVAPPGFDHGVFLLHYNRGREAFQEGRYAEARREFEQAQRLRPDDSDVLNLLGLVYFKTNSFPEAEVIYRRLVRENPNVFILHSNLGLILFKQGKLDESEQYLRRAIELRPNYAKSHLYLGLLYRQKRKYGLALEHLRFAGADKLVREVEAEIRPAAAPAAPKPVSPPQVQTPVAPPAALARPRPVPPSPSESSQPVHIQPKTLPGSIRTPDLPDPQRVVVPSTAAYTAARKLQDAMDDTHPLPAAPAETARRIEGASKTFALHENGFLEINFAHNVCVKKGTVSSYSGNLKFTAESGLVGTTAQMLVKVVGEGKIFVFEKGRKTFLLDLNDEFVYVEGSNLLALEESLSYRVEPIYDSSYSRKIDTMKMFGKGSLALSTSIEPLTLRVTKEYPLSIAANALVAWTGNLIPTVVDDQSLENVMIDSDGAPGFQIRFDGEGVVIAEQ